VKSKEARQRCAGHIVAAAQESQRGPANYRNDSRDLGTYLGGKERELVPGKQIPAEPKTDHDEEQDYTAEQGDLARRVRRAQKENAEQVNEQRRNHQIR